MLGCKKFLSANTCILLVGALVFLVGITILFGTVTQLIIPATVLNGVVVDVSQEHVDRCQLIRGHHIFVNDYLLSKDQTIWDHDISIGCEDLGVVLIYVANKDSNGDSTIFETVLIVQDFHGQCENTANLKGP